ncbi:MAG: hypothetical protein B7X04_02780 [Parcubacteria group bacterium 21-54-25]|nr:MAG: hypothetical protein B7X04_02780 [Parcubacteria group bacterium 21-54-25]
MFAPEEVPSISVQEAHQRFIGEKCLLIDVRTPEEFAAGHPAGARNIPLAELPAHVDKLTEHHEIYLICQSGGRSVIATNALHERGLTQAINVTGGFLDWQGKGLPTEQ